MDILVFKSIQLPYKSDLTPNKGTTVFESSPICKMLTLPKFELFANSARILEYYWHLKFEILHRSLLLSFMWLNEMSF